MRISSSDVSCERAVAALQIRFHAAINIATKEGEMELECPNCQRLIDVPDKAVLLWSGSCDCGAMLHVETVERHDDRDNADYVALELRTPEQERSELI